MGDLLTPGKLKPVLLLPETSGRPKRHRHVRVGSTVELQTESGVRRYLITDSWRSKALTPRMRTDSPLGLSLLGKHEGDTVTITGPLGSFDFTVIGIH